MADLLLFRGRGDQQLELRGKLALKGAAPVKSRASSRVTLYLQDDDPSVSPLAWLGVGGATGPFGWTACDGKVSRDPSVAVAGAPPEPLDLSKELVFEVPQDSAGSKHETWLSPNGKKTPPACLEHVRRSREVSNRIAENERELQILIDDVQHAGVLMRRSEQEVKILPATCPRKDTLESKAYELSNKATAICDAHTSTERREAHARQDPRQN